MQESMLSLSYYTNRPNIKGIKLTLTFSREIYGMYVTHPLAKLNILAKLFQNSPKYVKDTAMT